MRALRALVGPLFVVAGALHFKRTRWYLSIMPDYLPAHRELVYASGAAEMAGGAGPHGSRGAAARRLVADRDARRGVPRQRVDGPAPRALPACPAGARRCSRACPCRRSSSRWCARRCATALSSPSRTVSTSVADEAPAERVAGQIAGEEGADEGADRHLQVGLARAARRAPRAASRTARSSRRRGATRRSRNSASSSGVSRSSASIVPSMAIPLGRSSPARSRRRWATRSARTSAVGAGRGWMRIEAIAAVASSAFVAVAQVDGRLAHARARGDRVDRHARVAALGRARPAPRPGSPRPTRAERGRPGAGGRHVSMTLLVGLAFMRGASRILRSPWISLPSVQYCFPAAIHPRGDTMSAESMTACPSRAGRPGRPRPSAC